MLVLARALAKHTFILICLTSAFIAILLRKVDSAVLSSSQDGICHGSEVMGSPASSLFYCAADCSSSSDCTFFGFEPATGACHHYVQNRITMDRTDQDDEQKEEKNCSQSITTFWLKESRGLCTNRTCKLKDVIRDHYKAVSSFVGKGPYVRMEMPPVHTYFFTPISQDRLRVITGNTSTIIFYIRTCMNANLMISDRYTKDRIIEKYRIVIGGWRNRKSIIRKCNHWRKRNTNGISMCKATHIDARHKEEGIVSCKEFRPFWISWKNGTIFVGKGLVHGNQSFMKLGAPGLLPVTNICISSCKDNKGTWLFVPQI